MKKMKKMKKILLLLFTVFTSTISFSQIYLSNNADFPRPIPYRGINVIFEDIYALIGNSVAEIEVTSTSNPSIVISSTSGYSIRKSLTITGPGFFSINYKLPGNEQEIRTYSVEVVSLIFTQKPASVVSFNGTNLVINVIATTSGLFFPTYIIESSEVGGKNKKVDFQIASFTEGDGYQLNPGKAKRASITVTGIGKVTFKAFAETIDNSFSFNVVSGTGVDMSSTPRTNVSTSGTNLDNVAAPALNNLAISTTATSAVVMWGTVAGANSYCIEVYINSNLSTFFTSTCGLSSPEYTIIYTDATKRLSLNKGSKTYYYRVAAENATSKTPFSTTASVTLNAAVTSTNTDDLPSFLVYPNPSESEFTINAMSFGASIKIKNMLGADVAFVLSENKLTVAEKGIFYLIINGKAVKIIVK